MRIEHNTVTERWAVGDVGPALPVDPVHPELIRRMRQTALDDCQVTILHTTSGPKWIAVTLPERPGDDRLWMFLIQGDPRTTAWVVFPRPDGTEGSFAWDAQQGPAPRDRWRPEEIAAWAWQALLDHASGAIGEACADE